MPPKNQVALDFLLTRRSRPAKTLTKRVPNKDELKTILIAAARTPDHGKLEPWRFIVLEKIALRRIAEDVTLCSEALNHSEEQIAKAQAQYANADLAVVVVSSPVKSEKIPLIEQVYSAGAVCLSMLNAALAAGWGANWLSGWPTHDRTFVEKSLGLSPDESVAGIIHIGTETNPPPERPRPNLDQITTWMRT